jgi:uncharacterized protein (UPF0262 family)
MAMPDASMDAPSTQRLLRIELPDSAPLPSAYAEADRTQAVADLLVANRFDPEGLPGGPYALHLSLREGRLIFDIRDTADQPLHALMLALGPFRRLIKDYHMVVESHERAVTKAATSPASRPSTWAGAACTTRARNCWPAPARPRGAGFRDGAAAVHPGLCPAPADLKTPWSTSAAERCSRCAPRPLLGRAIHVSG